MALASEKIGISDTTITSGKNKDLLNPFREVRTNHVEILSEMVDAMYDRFLNIVKEGRALDDETGEVKWNNAIGDTIHGSVLIHDDVLYTGSVDRNIYALKLAP